jgi:hypothetical protein
MNSSYPYPSLYTAAWGQTPLLGDAVEDGVRGSEQKRGGPAIAIVYRAAYEQVRGEVRTRAMQVCVELCSIYLLHETAHGCVVH